MNFTFGFPVRPTTSLFTWYGVRSLIRSAQALLSSPIDTQTSV